MTISKEDVLEFIPNLSILELSELVKEFEEGFGVSIAPVMVTSGTATGGAATVTEEKTEFDIVLVDSGTKKIEIIKVVHALIGLGLKEARDAIEQTLSTLKESVAKADAEEVKKQPEETGAKVELK